MRDVSAIQILSGSSNAEHHTTSHRIITVNPIVLALPLQIRIVERNKTIYFDVDAIVVVR